MQVNMKILSPSFHYFLLAQKCTTRKPCSCVSTVWVLFLETAASSIFCCPFHFMTTLFLNLVILNSQKIIWQEVAENCIKEGKEGGRKGGVEGGGRRGEEKGGKGRKKKGNPCKTVSVGQMVRTSN